MVVPLEGRSRQIANGNDDRIYSDAGIGQQVLL